MKFTLFLPLILTLTVLPSLACIYEIREAVFYPNSTQFVGRDWIVVNFTNSYSFSLYDVNLSYRGESVYLPYIPSNSNVRIDPYKTLPAQPFPLRVEVTAAQQNDQVNVTYSILNDYTKDLDVSVKVPKPENFLACYSCSLEGDKLNFSDSIPAGSYRQFTIAVIGSSAYIGEAEMSFALAESIEVEYGVDLQFSIEKSNNGNKWFATFNVKNNLDRNVSAVLEAWVELEGSKTPLFTEKVSLEAGENLSFTHDLTSDTAPVFFMRVRATVEDSCSVTVIPAFRSGGNYVVGEALIAPFSFIAATAGGGGGGAGGGTVGGGAGISPGSWPSQSEGSHETSQPSPQPLPVFVNLPSLSLPEIPPEVAKGYVLMIFPAAYGLFIALFFSPLSSRRGVVVTSDAVTQENYAFIRAYGRRIYTTPSNVIPGSLVISPSEEMVRKFMELGLKREYAESIAAAIILKKPLITSSREVAEMAIRNGCIPILIRGGGIGRT